MEMLATVNQAQFLWWLSWWGLGTGAVGLWSGRWWLHGMGVALGSVFARAYWRRPVRGWRRNLDMVWIQLLIWTHLWSVLTGEPVGVAAAYVGIQAAGAALYGVSWWFLAQGRLLEATACHAGVHAAANLSLLFLYLGVLERW